MNIFNSICNFKIKACIFGTVLAVLSGTPHSYATQPAQFKCTLNGWGAFTVTRSAVATICEQYIKKENYGHGKNHFMPMEQLMSFLLYPSDLEKNTEDWIHSMLISEKTIKEIISKFIDLNKTKSGTFRFYPGKKDVYYTEIDFRLDKSFFSDDAIYLAISNIGPSDTQSKRELLREVTPDATIKIRIVFKGLKPKTIQKPKIMNENSIHLAFT